MGLAARSCDGGGEREVGKEAADPAHCRGGYTSKGLRKRSTRRRAMGSEGYGASRRRRRRRRRRHSSPSRNLRGGGGGNAAACRQTTRVGHQDTYLKTAEYVSSACSRGETATTCSFQKEKSRFYPQEIPNPPHTPTHQTTIPGIDGTSTFKTRQTTPWTMSRWFSTVGSTCQPHLSSFSLHLSSPASLSLRRCCLARSHARSLLGANCLPAPRACRIAPQRAPPPHDRPASLGRRRRPREGATREARESGIAHGVV